MSVTQLPLVAPPHRNQQLFSDHYLNVVLPQRNDWRSLKTSARPALDAIHDLLDAWVPSPIEAQVEDRLVRPILRLLGHTFDVQPSLVTPDGTKSPDYVFYYDQSRLDENAGKTLTEELLHPRAYAVGDAKHWDRKLDIALRNATVGDPFTNKNPSYQIAFYMQHSGLEWGILTNGRLWRLYHRSTAHKLDRFYEVDLPALVASQDIERFLYFYAFFRRAAFDQHPLAVSELLRASTDYARGVGETLKTQVFQSLRHLAQGFLDYPANGLEPDPATLKAIYNNSLITLYRLLFVLYAEARGLLPVRESRSYRESYSLHAIAHDVARDLNLGIELLPTSAIMWPKLRQLFAIIDRGSPPLQVATFNGGLFDPEKHPFLERYVVGDAHLQRAIDTLTRVDGEFIDYRDLAEQHLGTIYEGLLEYHLAPIEPAGGWAVDIVNDRGERKITGSYYTPNYIVKHIVAAALDPVLEAAVDDKTDDAAKIAAVLNVNVLDPAMGSAYFLVEATEHIARFLVDQNLVPDTDTAGEPDLAYWKRRVVQSCIYGVDLNPLAVDLAKLSLWLSTVARDQPLSFLDHHLRTGNSLVGASVTDLSVQDTSPNARRRAAQRAKRAAAAGQLSMLEDDAFRATMGSAVGSMWQIEDAAADTVAAVKEQERLYTELRETLTRRYRRLADLATATKLGLEVDMALWQPLADYAMGRTITAPPQLVDWINQADAMADRERFFHWELEFPEVFFDRTGQPLGEAAGFDVVVGNPPYVRQERLAPLKPYLRSSYTSFHSTADLYLYFFERGIQVLQQDGWLGFISSGTFSRANFARPFREYFPAVAQIESIINFGENQPFAGAEMVHPMIVVVSKGAQQTGFRYLFIDGSVPDSLDLALRQSGGDVSQEVLQQPEWTFQDQATAQLTAKIFAGGEPLVSATGAPVFYGIKTGLNEAFIIDQATRDQIVAADPGATQLIKHMASGEDLRPWYVEEAGQWMIVVPSGWTRSRFGEGLAESAAWEQFQQLHPSLAAHLAPFADAARKRQDKGEYWWELRSCDYYWAFDTPKIIWPDIAKLPRFSLDTTNRYLNNTAYFLPQADYALLGLLQSRVIWFAISQISQPLRLRAGLWQYRFFRQYLNRLPIPELSPDDRAHLAALAEELSQLAQARYELGNGVRRRIATDLAAPGQRLNQKLIAWWNLDFPAFRGEIKKALKREIPVHERDEWDAWLRDRCHAHTYVTARIIQRERELNDCVYRLFGLSTDEIARIEDITKYQYGEV